MKGYKSYKFEIGQAVMKANPQKLGGRKGDRMTPDWLSGYVIEKLTDQQVVLCNTKTNKVLKSMSLVHIKPFRERGVVDMSKCGDEVGTDGNEVTIFCHGDEIAGAEVESAELAGVEVPGAEVAGAGVAGAEVGGAEVLGVEVAGKEVAGGELAGAKVTGDEVENDEVVGDEVAEVVAGDSNVAVDEKGDVIFAEALKYLRQLDSAGIPLCGKFLDVGPTQLTRRDIGSLIPPHDIPASDLKFLTSHVPDFTPGWLSDMVS